MRSPLAALATALAARPRHCGSLALHATMPLQSRMNAGCCSILHLGQLRNGLAGIELLQLPVGASTCLQRTHGDVQRADDVAVLKH